MSIRSNLMIFVVLSRPKLLDELLKLVLPLKLTSRACSSNVSESAMFELGSNCIRAKGEEPNLIAGNFQLKASPTMSIYNSSLSEKLGPP